MSEHFRLLYCSRNLIAGSAAEIEAEIRGILATSRANNGRDGISGALLFSAGCFAQVLEGPLAIVERTFERIQRDERHGSVTVLQAASIASRDFPAWSMAFTGAGRNPLAHAALDTAFAGSRSGDEVLSMMRDIVVRENAWAIA